jgi:UDP-N-acetylglucosamine 1-carboxyvinyltransferase
MAAALLTPDTVTLHNIPYVRDIITQRRLLEDIGATVLTPELRTHKITAAHVELFGRTLRAREDDARVSTGARTAARSLRQSESLLTGRLCNRNAAN